MITARQLRKKRVRAKISGTSVRPRLCVFRSLKHISAQLIDDASSRTLVFSSDAEAKAKGKKPAEAAKLVGRNLAEKALAKKISEAVFDRGGYKYHGRVKALAEGARESGLKF